jgi:predicted HTH transcriptional regulator
MDHNLKKLIAGGENQQLDFKFCVSDSRKIARTLAAFANSDGGRLLIGVKDNGSIAGISSCISNKTHGHYLFFRTAGDGPDSYGLI